MTLGRPIRTLDWDFVWLVERAFSLPNEATSWEDVSLELPMVMTLLPQLMSKRKMCKLYFQGTPSEGKWRCGDREHGRSGGSIGAPESSRA